MKRAAAGVLTALLMALLLWRGRSGEGPLPIGPIDNLTTTTSPTPPDPLAGASARVQALLEAGRAGDVAAYLDAFGPPLRARLERTIAEGGRDAFAAGLKAAAKARRGRAVFDPVPDGPDDALVTVEFVYDDRNERQTFRLRREGDATSEGWRVVDVAGVRGREPASRYGTLASFEGPEGNPVAPGAPPPAPDRKGP
jgi:hypothetical protein